MTTPAQRYYGRWASLYDRVADLPGLRSWRARTAELLACSPGDTVVEMGCGTGANVPYLREQVGPDGRVVGIDLTGGMLAQARAHEDRVGPTVDYVQGDATRPPITGADAILATFVVGMFEDPATVVDRWCDLVGPGGRVVLLNFQRSERALAAPLNLAFEGFVRLSSPGGRLSTSSHAAAFEQRVSAAREALTARTDNRRFEPFAGGYLGALAGTVVA
jgi:phosphatidylethanolamine/phosphatidyl-N-methylethanolamine N-methyltransferase